MAIIRGTIPVSPKIFLKIGTVETIISDTHRTGLWLEYKKSWIISGAKNPLYNKLVQHLYISRKRSYKINTFQESHK